MVFAIVLLSKEKYKLNLIPREVLFGNPIKAKPRISPDGQNIAYLAPVNDVLNVFVGHLTNSGIEDVHQVTFSTKRGIVYYFWSPDSSQILYLQDTDGDENWRLYGVDVMGNEDRCYTPYDNIKVSICGVSKLHKDYILIALNKDNPQEHDVYKLTLATGAIEMIAKNPGGVVGWLDDQDLNIRGAYKTLDDGSRQLLIKDENDQWRPVITWGMEDSMSGPLSFCLDPRYIYLEDSRDVNAKRCIKYDTQNDSFEVIIEDETYDFGGMILNDTTLEPLAASVYKDKQEWIILDPTFEEDFKTMRALDDGEMLFVSTDEQQQKYIIVFIKDNGPAAYYLYDKQKKSGSFLFSNKPDLSKYQLARMEPIKYTARDGLEIHGYLTLPEAIEQKNLPLVLLVHGGPWVRDSWGYDPEVQWLANRGYAVLQVNFRGSTGYGKKFLNAANKEWAGKMHDDLIDGVNWVIDKGIADPKKVAIYGGSYGGYAALVGATFTPDVFCCAVDIVGMSNLITMMNSIPSYWEPLRRDMYMRVGNLETEEEFLKSCSPLFKVDQIKIPILIAQGANDPRVKQAESEQIVAALKDKGLRYEYLLFEDEGHGFARAENRMVFYTAAEKFLAQHLSGKYQS